MANELIFLTGATGFLGFAILAKALTSGHRVRISVRKSEQITTIQNHRLIAPFVSQNKLEFVIVPDITTDGAFDSALKDVTGILHVASPLPLPTEDPERDVITPAIHGTTTILNSALKSPSVRRVVITSSELAIVPSPYTSSPPNTVYTPRFRLNPLPSAPWGNPSEVYQASKALALDASERFLAEKNPHFTVINLLPSYVIGRNELATTSEDLRKGSNNVPLSILNGVIWPTPRPAVAVYIGDVARIHVEALDEEKVKGNATFILEGKNGKEGGELVLDDAVAVAKEYFEDAVKEGILPLGGHTESAVHNMDASETVKVFGELKGYKDSVREVVEQFVELKRKELAGN